MAETVGAESEGVAAGTATAVAGDDLEMTMCMEAIKIYSV